MTTLDETTETFAGRMIDAVDQASIAILASIGHQTGLFDTMARLPAATSVQIADAAGLDERYVREWLGGMVTGRVVDYDKRSRTYVLPPHRAAVLTSAAGPDNLALVAQFIPLLGEIEQKIVGCFRTGGGLPYTDYPRFHALMAEQSGAVFDAALVDGILPLVDGLPELLRAGADVSDWGCGSGHAVNVMARAFPKSRFTGIDFSADAIARGVQESQQQGFSNATFVRADLAAVDVTDAYDAITVFDAIHDQAQPAHVLANIYRALRPGGVLLMVDIKSSSNLEDNVGVPLEHLLVHRVDHALYVGVAGRRRGGTGNRVGAAAGDVDAVGCRIRRRRSFRGRLRSDQPLLRRAEVTGGGVQPARYPRIVRRKEQAGGA